VAQDTRGGILRSEARDRTFEDLWLSSYIHVSVEKRMNMEPLA
jgi:hypothetical protein